MSAAEIEQIAEILDRFGLTRIEYETHDTRFVLEKLPAAVVQGVQGAGALVNAGLAIAGEATPQAAQAGSGELGAEVGAGAGAAVEAGAEVAVEAALIPKTGASNNNEPASAASITPEDKVIEAPLTGIAYRTKEPGVPPFVEVGSVVQEGDVLCLIEAMKMFSEVKASVAGTVAAIHFDSAALVEKGAPLVTLT
ncbi:MAG: hypothetical protein FWE96_08040 [Coriobacteriia bacterium]|nr:hypothetical protein [Coriobacteriia bacterium]